MSSKAELEKRIARLEALIPRLEDEVNGRCPGAGLPRALGLREMLTELQMNTNFIQFRLEKLEAEQPKAEWNVKDGTKVTWPEPEHWRGKAEKAEARVAELEDAMRKHWTRKCRSCGAEIVWAKTDVGNQTPINPEPVPEGNIRLDHTARGIVATRLGPLEVEVETGPLYLSHWASCPKEAV